MNSREVLSRPGRKWVLSPVGCQDWHHENTLFPPALFPGHCLLPEDSSRASASSQEPLPLSARWCPCVAVPAPLVTDHSLVLGYYTRSPTACSSSGRGPAHSWCSRNVSGTEFRPLYTWMTGGWETLHKYGVRPVC